MHDVILSDKDSTQDFKDLETVKELAAKINKKMRMVKCYKRPEHDYRNGEPPKHQEAVFYNTVRNGFVSACAMAYNYHLPLILSPNDVWLVVLQGFRVHMSQQKDKAFMKLTFKDMDKITADVKKGLKLEDKAFDNLEKMDDLKFEQVLFKHIDKVGKSIWNSKHCAEDFDVGLECDANR